MEKEEEEEEEDDDEGSSPPPIPVAPASVFGSDVSGDGKELDGGTCEAPNEKEGVEGKMKEAEGGGTSPPPTPTAPPTLPM